MADKIDQLKLKDAQGNDVLYDIDLPVDATPSIASLTASGNVSAATFNNKTITTVLGSDDTTIPTSKAVSDAISAAGGGTVTSVGAGTGLSISGTATVNPTVNIAEGYKLLTTTDWKNDSVYSVMSLSTVAGSSTSGSVKSVRWYVSGVEGITTPYNGMKLAVKIPLAGVSTGGVILSINGNNDADYHPVAYNVNTVFTTHFGVNSIKYLTYDANQTMTCYKTAGTSVSVTGVWKFDADYDSNTTITYGTVEYYFRPYVGTQALYRYKLVMQDKDNRLVPLTITNVSNGTAVTNQTPTNVAFKPDKIWFYSATSTISAGSVVGGQVLWRSGYNANNSTNGGMAVCNFNSTISAYRMLYLCGTYDKTTGLFSLRGGGTASSTQYYTQIPTNTANITLSSYFTSGYDYILVGGTYSSNNYIQLFDNNPMYHFDGTNLVPYDTYNENRIEGEIPTETTVSGWGFTKNTGTITGVSVNGTSIATSGVAALTNIAKTNSDNNFSSAQTFTSGVKFKYISTGTTAITLTPANPDDNYTLTLPARTDTIATLNDIPSTGNFVTTNTEQTISGQKTFTSTNTYVSGCGFSSSTNLLSDTHPAAMRGLGSNPFFGLRCNSTNYYLQATSAGLYLGPTSTVATSWDANGNITIRGTAQPKWGTKTLATTDQLSSYVPTSRTINGKALSSDITLSASDVQALPNTTSYVKSASVSGNTLTLTTTGLPVTYTPTMPPTITINTTNKTISDGTNTLTFGSNAFNSTAIPTSYVSSVNGSTGAITNVAKTNTNNSFPYTQTFTGTIDVSGGTLKLRTINAPTTSGGSSYGAGTDGQVLKTNGSTVYWGNSGSSLTLYKHQITIFTDLYDFDITVVNTISSAMALWEVTNYYSYHLFMMPNDWAGAYIYRAGANDYRINFITLSFDSPSGSPGLVENATASTISDTVTQLS